MLHGMPIKWKITILSFGIVLFSLLIGGIILIGNMQKIQEEELGQRLLVTARTVAQLPAVIRELSQPSNHIEGINEEVEHIRIINDVDYIVVMDMNRKRLTHPLQEKIGTLSNGMDEGSAFAEHTYVTKAKGDLGIALRAFVPVMNDQNIQVGVVLVGHLLPSLWDLIANTRGQAYLILCLTLLFGVLGSWLLASHIKKQMFHLEPAEIARILLERTATFHAMHEGVIAIDNQERITIFNEKAMQMLNISGDPIGKSILEVIPYEKLTKILTRNQAVYNQELQIGDIVILLNCVPITLHKNIVGSVAIFQDRTEVTRIAEELTGVRTFVEALRVQNHEFMNRLHTIGGLIQLDNKEKALEYIFQITEQKEELTRVLSSKIRDGTIAGLLLAKVSRAKELGIDLYVDIQNKFDRYPEFLDHHDFVILFGNLIENAFDSLMHKDGNKKVVISIEPEPETLTILVEDNGMGMEPHVKQRMFERGYSTKEGKGRGIGLYLVKRIIDKGKGRIEVDSEIGQGTTFIVTFPLKGSEVSPLEFANNPRAAD